MKDFRNHLLLQIEMLRAGISHEELSKRLGSQVEGCLARYIAGKTHLQDSDFRGIASALRIDPKVLARQWAASLGLRISERDPVRHMVDRAFDDYLTRRWGHGVPPQPSPMAVIRVKYADRLAWETPDLWLGRRDTFRNRERFTRAYGMLVESVHLKMSHRDIGALRGISGTRAADLMQQAAYRWAKARGINLTREKIPWKNDAKYVRNLYAGLRFFAQQQFNILAAIKDPCDEKKAG